MIPQHQSKTVEHYTPEHVVTAARQVLGRINLDPASCAKANETVKARRYYTERGLEQSWFGRVFCNPPGGLNADTRWGTKSNAAAWWRKLMLEYRLGHVQSAIFVGFTLELLRSTQGDDWPTPLDGHVLCVPKSRLCFSGNSPTHANVIIGVNVDPWQFAKAFESIGACAVAIPPKD